MTVLVNKRYAKMKANDLKVKPEPKSGWWISFATSAYLYIEANQVKARSVFGSSVYTPYEILAHVKRAHYRRGATEPHAVSLDSVYRIYPKYKKSTTPIRTYLTADEYYKELFDDAVTIIDGQPVYHYKESPPWRYTIADLKFTRYNSCPPWAAILEIDSTPVKVAA